MKRFCFVLWMMLAACNQQQVVYQPAENALDAGREFIDACLKGDFGKAAFHMLPDAMNADYLQKAENRYRTYDKEGRQQLRQASINISEISDINDSTSIIYYNNSFEKTPLKVKVVFKDNRWRVDFKYTYNPNL